MRYSAILLLLISAATYAESNYDTLELSSGEQRVALIELYTSEGCSSCPPADRWLSTLKDDPRLWTQFVPIALHVDYWDYIGWKDRYANADFSRRQRRHIQEGAARSVYTPGVFENGKEWLGWRRGQRASTQRDAVGNLNLELDANTLTANFQPETADGNGLELHVAILGMGLETKVRAGENKGNTLQHDFVVLDLTQFTMEKRDGGYRVTSELPALSTDAKGLALVGWISEAGSQTPIQTVGGYIVSEFH